MSHWWKFDDFIWRVDSHFAFEIRKRIKRHEILQTLSNIYLRLDTITFREIDLPLAKETRVTRIEYSMNRIVRVTAGYREREGENRGR